MTVSNNQLANQTTFNNAFMSRTANDSTVGKKDLANAESASGPTVTNAQREINSLNSFSGRASGSVYNVTPTWTNNDVGSSGNNLKDRAEALTAEFNNTTGHTHDGASGNGGQISAANLSGINYYTGVRQVVTVTTGAASTTNVTSTFSGQTPGGNTTTQGVVTSSPYNKCYLVNQADGTAFVDAGGQVVYARLTESSGTWTLSYFTNEAGVETSYSFGTTQTALVYYIQVYSLANVPTFSEDAGYIQSLDLTQDIVDASTTQRGLVNTTTQSFNGSKTFEGTVSLRSIVNLELANNTQSGASVTLTAPTTAIVRLTNASLTSIDGIVAPSNEQIVALFNVTGADIAIEDDNAGTAVDGILTGSGANFDFLNDSAVLLMYDTTTQRWRMIGGGGGGGGGGALLVTGTRASPQNVVAGTGIAFTGTDARQSWFIQGNSTGINDITANPQIAAGVTVGQELILVGRSNANTVLLEDGNGLSLNGSYEMGEDSVLYLFWDGSNWVETSRRE